MRIDVLRFFAGPVVVAATLCAPVMAQTPLSAIDWLSDSVTVPVAVPPSSRRTMPPRRDITTNALPEPVSVQALGAPDADRVGLLSADRAGVPETLWMGSDSAELVRALSGDRSGDLPAMRQLLVRMLKARTTPPAGVADGRLFLARVDALMALGRLTPAAKLLERAEREKPAHFRRWFDIALLTGEENRGCARMRQMPDITPTYAARVFCLARGGDWAAAAVTLDNARALGITEKAETDLLARFLDLDEDESEGVLSTAQTPSPLEFAMYEAIGEPLGTPRLPIAFAHADLREQTGWKARIEAAERLARSGAIAPDRLWDIYGEREPAASGGVWDRVAAVQKLENALEDDDVELVSLSLVETWAAMRKASLDHVLARKVGLSLSRLTLTNAASQIARDLTLLAGVGPPDGTSEDQRTRFLLALAEGNPGDAPAYDEMSRAIRDGFANGAPPRRLVELASQQRLGEALLRVMEMMNDGESGNFDALEGAIAFLRSVGLSDVARQAALELSILERRG